MYERDRGNETERVCVRERAREKERKVSECQRDRARERERKRDFDMQNKPCHPYVKVTSYVGILHTTAVGETAPTVPITVRGPLVLFMPHIFINHVTYE